MEFSGTGLVSITKEVTFDCAHTLTDHPSKCTNLHGHTYKLQVTFSRQLGEPELQIQRAKEEKSFKKEGMVLDFGNMKNLIEKIIVAQMDHACIINFDAPVGSFENELGLLLMRHNKKIAWVHGRTTCENMVRAIFDKLTNRLALETPKVNIERVVLYETPTSFATVERMSR